MLRPSKCFAEVNDENEDTPVPESDVNYMPCLLAPRTDLLREVIRNWTLLNTIHIYWTRYPPAHVVK